jgi:HK97 family phage prohead protease
MIKLNAQAVTVDAAKGDEPTRTITGIAVPYGETAIVSDGQAVRFEQGALPVDGKAPKLFMYHDSSQPVGLVTARQDTDQGMLFSARISTTAAGDEALTLALDGVLDSVSVGVNPTKFRYDDEGTMIVEAADWLELSLVPIPAFAGAEIEKVYASAENVVLASQEEPDTEPTPEQVEETETVDAVQPEAVVEAATPTAPIPAQVKRNFGMPSAGEYLAAYHIGGETWQRVNAAATEVMRSRQTAIQAAAGDVLTTDTPGLLPVPVLGPVFDNLNYIRPVVAAVGARAMPDGGQSKTWIRPTWATHTSVGAQSPELSGVSATTPVIASNVVTKTTLAGQVTLSVQDIDFTSPAALEIILRDLAGQYMLQSDNVAADALRAGASASGSTWTITANDPTSLIAAIYDAATDILNASNFLPDHIFVSPGVWKALGSQLDVDKRPIFPYTGAAGLMGINGVGSANVTQMNTFNPLGLNLVVDRTFNGDTMIVARAQAFEFYEQVRGIMSVEVPATLGRTFSYYGYVSTFVADANQIKSIAIA